MKVNILTAEDILYVRKYLSYNPTTGALISTRRSNEGIELGSFDLQGYGRLVINGRQFKAHRVIWFIMTGVEPIETVDHINGNRSDNRWSNLREATGIENSRNRKPNGHLSHKGVQRLPSGRFRVRIQQSGRRMTIGTHDTMAEALKSYNIAAKKYFGAFAHPNILSEATT